MEEREKKVAGYSLAKFLGGFEIVCNDEYNITSYKIKSYKLFWDTEFRSEISGTKVKRYVVLSHLRMVAEKKSLAQNSEISTIKVYWPAK